MSAVGPFIADSQNTYTDLNGFKPGSHPLDPLKRYCLKVMKPKRAVWVAPLLL